MTDCPSDPTASARVLGEVRSRIRDMVRRPGLRAAEVATAAGVDEKTIRNWQEGRFGDGPMLTHLVTVCTVVGVSLDVILGADDIASPLEGGGFLVDDDLVDRLLTAESQRDYLNELADYAGDDHVLGVAGWWMRAPRRWRILSSKQFAKLRTRIHNHLHRISKQGPD